MWKRFQAMPTWAKVIAILVAIALFSKFLEVTGIAPASEPAKPVAPVAKQATKSLGERVFPSTLVIYTESEDGRILVSFDVQRMTKESAESDVRRFMSELTRDKAKTWRSATISAMATFYDAYGASRKDAVLTFTFQHDEAMRVVDWSKANLVAVGLREYALPQFR